MKTVVLGAGGLLGRHVLEELRGQEARGFDRRGCDVASLEQVRAAVAGAGCVINCAAFTNVDASETRPDDAYRANALAAENVVRAAREVGAAVVHVSTDFVFDGAKPEPYDEFDAPNPISIYGRSKRAGEQLAERVGGKLFLVRVQALYGRGGTNFASKLRELLKSGKRLTLDAERRVQPTWARAAARQIVRLAATDHYGTYHVSCGGETTWAGFARLVAGRLGVEPNWTEVSSRELNTPAARPPNCRFERRMLKLRGLDCMPEWQAACEEYLREEERA
jgi:dTDP-4-dehydrorhamnose reductase